MTDTELAYLSPLKVGKVGKCALKVGKSRDLWEQRAKFQHAKNCKLRFEGCEWRFTGCGFAYLANLLPSFAGVGRQAQTPVFIGLQGCLPTLPTYLLKGMYGRVERVSRQGCTGCTGGTRVHVESSGRQVGKVGKVGKSTFPPIAHPTKPANLQLFARSGARHHD